MSDDPEPLIQSAALGDPKAVEGLLARYLPGLRAFIRLRAGHVVRAKESASDLAQSVCREVLQHIDRFQYRGEAGFKNWLFTTALRKIANRQKFYLADKRDAAREANPGKQDSGVTESQLVDCYRNFYTPSQQAMQREELERVERAFEQLPEDYREVITLSRIVGLSRAEIAQQMNRSEGSVRMLLLRALAQLAEQIEQAQ